MNNIIYCFDKETKEQLLLSGYTFLNEVEFENSKAYVFLNNGTKIHFEKNKVFYSDKLRF
ncbi:hypothetical protein [Clostridium sp.]|uniref:hypothetical protein n=1 Tax=Clostridium sp. TaxID=1506 RepID=UPI001B65DA67|nr:hypothetical protein [Clostridium sp.]MBP3916383.1 hypothetical protein [Clostridium sp.]